MTKVGAMRKLFRNTNVYFTVFVRQPAIVLKPPDAYYHKLINALTNEHLVINEGRLKVVENGATKIFQPGERLWLLRGKLHSRFYKGAWLPAFIGINGDKCWRKHGIGHRVDGPTFLYANGDYDWYFEGKKHREDGPAHSHKSVNGLKEEWWIHGKKHRTDGPAVIDGNYIQSWYQNDEYHRIDGPALIYLPTPNNKWVGEYWYQYGKLHRKDGPASITSDGETWNISGLMHRDYDEVAGTGGPANIIFPCEDSPHGSKQWWRHGLLIKEQDEDYLIKYFDLNDRMHHDTLPAIKRDETQEWWRHGKWHRADGPAVIDMNGSTTWYIDGQRHREDGPAVIKCDGTQKWYQRGVLHREDGPAVVKLGGYQEWRNEGDLHRTEVDERGNPLPAIIYPNGKCAWYKDGDRFYPIIGK